MQRERVYHWRSTPYSKTVKSACFWLYFHLISSFSPAFSTPPPSYELPWNPAYASVVKHDMQTVAGLIPRHWRPMVGASLQYGVFDLHDGRIQMILPRTVQRHFDWRVHAPTLSSVDPPNSSTRKDFDGPPF